MKPHKHAEIIKAWADGAEIQFFDKDLFEWRTTTCPSWTEHMYRIKPQPKPDVVQFLSISEVVLVRGQNPENCNLKLTFDGETGKLKSAEVL